MKISYPSLSEEDKQLVAARLEVRKAIYLDALAGRGRRNLTLIVGDRPGPAAPKDPTYHHTPFYSTKYCSGWLNTALHLVQIPEKELVWMNSADKDGVATSPHILRYLQPQTIICLGGNAEKWMKEVNKVLDTSYTWRKFDHPQYHKRFKNKEEYPLIDFLHDLFYESEYF